MNQETWTAVDRYLTDLLEPADWYWKRRWLPVPPPVCPPLTSHRPRANCCSCWHACNGRKICEIGTLGGYSTIWLARALPAGGRLITLEFDPKHAEVARTNLTRADLAEVVELRVGRALDILPKLGAESCSPFDLIFIDADKPGTADYFAWALKLSRRGSLIVVDNVIRKGAVIDTASDDPNVRGMRRFWTPWQRKSLSAPQFFQTVGSKGYDGFALAYVMEPST